VKTIQNIILKDEFSDLNSNEVAYQKCISGKSELDLIFLMINAEKLNPILDVGVGSGDMLEFFPFISHGLEPNNIRYTHCKRKFPGFKIKLGWAENLPYRLDTFEMVLCWGTYCFLRSPIEFLFEVNRVLRKGFNLVLDVVLESTMALAQTVHKESFRRWVSLFGFNIIFEKEFGDDFHKRCAFVLTKIENSNFNRFLMPQSMGKINNYLEDRDWYMR